MRRGNLAGESVAHTCIHIINNMVTVELDILDVDDVIQKDQTGDHLRELVATVFNNCETADRHFWTIKSRRFSLCRSNDKGPGQGETSLTEKMRTHVNCCIRVTDKYLRLLSVLIKSREFHLAYPTAHALGEGLPIIEIPKSREGKPFIPTQTGQPSNYEFSVSHQCPYIGIARSRGVKVGLDIVTFDEINRRLYCNEREFVSAFRSSFAESEWNLITSSATVLNDFFLRWAMKEAYTKSLGLGMSLEFESFIITLDGVENLWDYISVNADPENGIVLPGLVQHCGQPNSERWSFFFLLIQAKERIKGCACACIPDSSIDKALTVNIRWMKVEELLSWHGNATGD